MKYNDIHIHHHIENEVKAKEILKAMDSVGLEKIVIISCLGESLKDQRDKVERVERIISECPERIYGLAWIEPKINTPIDFLEEVICDKKYRGFKMIPNNWYPNEDKLLPYYAKMVELNVPCLFHSGILYSDYHSSKYCRPVYFEDLIEIKNFKFALAHVSWPWTDECIALFGQWNYSRRTYGVTSQMFIDITPGTPPLYRKDVLNKLINFDVEVEDYMLFGSDASIGHNKDKAVIDSFNNIKSFIKKDIKLLKQLNIPDRIIKKIYYSNFDKFFAK